MYPGLFSQNFQTNANDNSDNNKAITSGFVMFYIKQGFLKNFYLHCTTHQ